MAKSTRAQEVSTGTSASYTEHEASDPVIRRAMLGEIDQPVVEEGETSSDGINSQQSSESELTSNEKPSQSHPRPAPTMENPSEQKEGTGQDSSAHSTDGGTRKTQSQPSGRQPAKKTVAKNANPKAARTRSMDGAEEDPEWDEFA